MIIFVFLLLVLIFFPSRIHIRDFSGEYLSRKTTTAMKGVLCVFILISHFTQNDFYPVGLTDISFMKFRMFYSQFPMVVAFTYSAYGIMEAIRVKGFDYIVKIPEKRILKTFVIFAVAQPVFMIVNMILGLHYSVTDTILAFTGWRTIGADNWFMFVIFVLYGITWVSFRMYREDYRKAAAVVTAGTAALIIALIKLNRDPYWYNTLMAFPMGFWLSLYREKLEKFLFRNRVYFPAAAAIIAAFALIWVGVCKMSDVRSILLYEICSCLWATAVILLTMKIDVFNPVLLFLGKNLFGYYMMHRAVLLLMPRFFPIKGFLRFSQARFIVFFLLSTLLAWGFAYVSEKAADLVMKKLRT